MWIRSEECKGIIKEGWEKEPAETGLSGIRLKLERVGNKLSSWGWAKFGHIKGRIQKLRRRFSKYSSKQHVSMQTGSGRPDGKGAGGAYNQGGIVVEPKSKDRLVDHW
ncbi:hypothetical protein U1Q18_050013 [Sarracenia purpurea var. burkii]